MTTPAPQITPPQALTSSEARTWTMLAHLSGLLAFAGPLVVFLLQKDKSEVVAREAKESLNFQISIAIYFTGLLLAGTVLTFVVVGVFILMLAPLVPLAGAILTIVAAVKANSTGSYRYPLTIRLVR
ncbi:DUF4870 domain-containing protein [Amnibacterium flavum]|uniref:DUF4870 domain-containing protein n=1 Tax=Amnibacterium flavum TaxID=2173173 RepID=A0A2V1HUK2_9MICO|nr:DUF4870 domain-containing protein [Amnibacterium flavum]PVZ96258.1 DUF4870 domain-containing protein [Amnibacterium flavum]